MSLKSLDKSKVETVDSLWKNLSFVCGVFTQQPAFVQCVLGFFKRLHSKQQRSHHV